MKKITSVSQSLKYLLSDSAKKKNVSSPEVMG
jgi:hypothetical protein